MVMHAHEGDAGDSGDGDDNVMQVTVMQVTVMILDGDVDDACS